MDGLLLDTERVCVRAFNETVEGFSMPAMPEVASACIGLRADGVRRTLEAALSGRVEYEEFYAHWRGLISTGFKAGIPVKAGVLELLEALKKQGIPCAVATSTRTEPAIGHLKTARLHKYFDAIIGGDQVENGKPSPEIYHKAARALGLVAAECVAFEDSDPGAMAAISAGATTVQVPDVNPSRLKEAKFGHLVAPTLLGGAHTIGLI